MPDLNFVYSTELVTLVLGVLVIYFAKHNECVRSMNLRLLLFSTHAIMTKAVCEFIILIVVNYMYYDEKWLIDVFCMVYLVLHVFVVTGILIYIHSLSGRVLNIRRINMIMFIVLALYLLGAMALVACGMMYYMEDQRLVLTGLIPYAEASNVIANIICYLIVMSHRREYPRTIYRYIRLFMPIMLAFQLLQCYFHEIIFITVAYMIIVTVLFFLYHNEVYNDRTGARNNDAYEAHLKKIFEKKLRYDVIMFRVDVNAEKMRSASWKERDELLRSYCRRIEYFGSKVNLYKLSRHLYAVVSSSQIGSVRQEVLNRSRDILEEASRDCAEFASFRVYLFHDHEGITSLEEMKSLSNYLALTKGIGDMASWNEMDDGDYVGFALYSSVERTLIDIVGGMDLNDDRIVCYAQPIYSVEDGKFHAAEALMRLRCNGQIVSPAVFLPIAERMHCIHSLTLIMLNKICQYIKENEATYDFNAITLNSTPQELLSKNYATEILDIINRNGVNPEKIRIELTEDSEVTINAEVKENLSILYDAGVRFYLDDFGTGYSNICELFNMKIHTIKFDKTMLYESIRDEDVRNSLTAVAQGFRAKGSNLLVEGVETDEQEKVALDMGFQLIQGFKYAKPVPIFDLNRYFSTK